MANLGGAEDDDEEGQERVHASFMALAEACEFQVNMFSFFWVRIGLVGVCP
jgi:hypothetical protein